MTKAYQQEISDGLSEFFDKPLSVAFNINLAKADRFGSVVKSVADVTGQLKEDEFIYQFASILVTAGIWNKNDQVFDKYEVWKARYTPLDKPSNLNHQPDKVVAHSSRVFPITNTENARVIPDTIDGRPNVDIPDIYHLLTVDTFYKYNIKAYQSVNEEYSKQIQKVYDAIVGGDLSVSMECIFANFDYAILFPDGSQKIIERNEHTSYLTKKLRHFKGTGEYQGSKIGMLMRDLMFTGKGITNDPANEASVIFPKDSIVFATQNYAKSEDIFKSEESLAYISSDNGEEKMKPEEMQARITELEKELEAKTKDLAEATKLKTELDTIKAELASTSEKLVKAEQENKDGKVALETANKTVEETKTKLSTAETEVNTLKTEKVKFQRVEKIKEVLGLSKEDAESNYVITASLEEKAFDNWLENTKKIVENKTASKTQLEQEVAKAKKEAEDLNKKLAEEQAKNLNKTDAGLGIASVEGDAAATAARRESLKTVFKKD